MPSTLRLLTVPLALAALLLMASTSAHATPSTPGFVPLALEEEPEGLEESEGEEEFEEVFCEEAEVEFELGEIDEVEVDEICAEGEEGSAGKEASGSADDDACPLRSARARAVESHDQLKVTVGYTSSKATGATIEVRAGSKRLVSVHRHLGKSGVLRLTKKLGKKEPNRIAVRFKAPSCGKFQTKSVKVG